MADMFDGGVSSVFSSFDATASQPAQNGAGTGTVNVGGLSPELVPAQMVSENVNLSGAGDSNVGKLLAQILPAVLAQSQSDRAAMEKRYEDKLLQQKEEFEARMRFQELKNADRSPHFVRSSVCISADCWVTGAGLQSKLEFTSFPLCI